MPNDERNLETMPDGALGLIPLESCKELGLKVDQYLVGWREKRQHQHQNDPAFKGYRREPQCRVSEPAKQRVSSKSLSAAMTCI